MFSEIRNWGNLEDLLPYCWQESIIEYYRVVGMLVTRSFCTEAGCYWTFKSGNVVLHCLSDKGLYNEIQELIPRFLNQDAYIEERRVENKKLESFTLKVLQWHPRETKITIFALRY
ncbi:hypothetical protein C5167_004893 [Papaver somniferum]|uniref:Uncharacterized protein n=1 Tax=Papaver somniferum TaxID=3469 RepID=A0A4Y7JC55_PAPSO|nr:hypothetical protein C5167_004893 [Papaver somniferum]